MIKKVEFVEHIPHRSPPRTTSDDLARLLEKEQRKAIRRHLAAALEDRRIAELANRYKASPGTVEARLRRVLESLVPLDEDVIEEEPLLDVPNDWMTWTIPQMGAILEEFRIDRFPPPRRKDDYVSRIEGHLFAQQKLAVAMKKVGYSATWRAYRPVFYHDAMTNHSLFGPTGIGLKFSVRNVIVPDAIGGMSDSRADRST